MTGGAQEQDWQVLRSEDIAFLQQTRGELEAILENQSRWTELMKSFVGNIPREKDSRRGEVFGQDHLGRGLLKGIPTAEVEATLSNSKSQGRLRALIAAIDGKIAELTPGPSPEEPSARRPKHAA